MPQKNLAFEMLKKLLNGEIRFRQRKNVVQARSFEELLCHSNTEPDNLLVRWLTAGNRLEQFGQIIYAERKKGLWSLEKKRLFASFSTLNEN